MAAQEDVLIVAAQPLPAVALKYRQHVAAFIVVVAGPQAMARVCGDGDALDRLGRNVFITTFRGQDQGVMLVLGQCWNRVETALFPCVARRRRGLSLPAFAASLDQNLGLALD